MCINHNKPGAATVSGYKDKCILAFIVGGLEYRNREVFNNYTDTDEAQFWSPYLRKDILPPETIQKIFIRLNIGVRGLSNHNWPNKLDPYSL